MQKTTIARNKTSNMLEKTFTTGGISIPYQFVKNRNSKYIRIRIGAEGMRVTAPIRTSDIEIETLLKLKSGWIYKHFTTFQSVREDEKSREWESGKTIFYLGHEYNIRFLKHSNKRTKVRFDEDEFEVCINDTITGVDREHNIENAFRSWFIDRAREIISERLLYFSKLTGLNYNTFKIKEQKTRWGSCSKKGNLNFNWKIIMAPQWVFDYVIIHEICHLKHLDHSNKYWALVSKYYPDYKKAQEWLKKSRLRF